MNFHRTSSNRTDVSRQKTIDLIANRIVELDLIDSCSNNNEIQLVHIQVLLAVRSTVSVSYISCNVIHQLQQSANSHVLTRELSHFSSEIVILLKRKSNLIEAMGRSGTITNVGESMFGLADFDTEIGAVEESLNDSVFDVIVCCEIEELLGTVKKGCLSD